MSHLTKLCLKQLYFLDFFDYNIHGKLPLFLNPIKMEVHPIDEWFVYHTGYTAYGVDFKGISKFFELSGPYALFVDRLNSSVDVCIGVSERSVF